MPIPRSSFNMSGTPITRRHLRRRPDQPGRLGIDRHGRHHRLVPANPTASGDYRLFRRQHGSTYDQLHLALNSPATPSRGRRNRATLDLAVTVQSGGASWNVNASGSWTQGSNWTTNPDGSHERHGDLRQRDQLAGHGHARRRRSRPGPWCSINTNGYTLPNGSGGPLTLGTAGAASIAVLSGTHTISADVALAGNLAVNATGGGVLELCRQRDDGGAGYGLTLTGDGELVLSGTGNYGGPTAVDGGTMYLTNSTALPAGDEP